MFSYLYKIQQATLANQQRNIKCSLVAPKKRVVIFPKLIQKVIYYSL